MSFMTRRITTHQDKVSNGAYTRSIPLGGQIVKQSYVTFVEEGKDLPEATVGKT